ncbi:DCC1-like thiol-disulfide oxidoreductase family protein [Flavobacterium sp. LB2P84]|jgi:predicted DCC family thiol-disulfide oxidoreductase YuxK|uniref:thiol-disulfide oxidoreductase DCC family protein n=1 Tax=Flavobacterium yafengii TaxID=3041253 RepID=UPI0024A9717E|nr:DCC1-like thiol-disulfide oxidoreductase family protein [Flavobacterium yafengii]MDI5898654.1 DCC1-like thiol-disulfide oxidoreductase family protein [Flavobacterium yafengii]MDI6034262.1 DCC1-like thiol-disulfide oxidoreductase family protein [Flavobacterium yafengii]MDI6046722.1 DCC1-like thiol-disulfide oxidoreductase family protein [Flavobacterium yafengii]
MLNIPKNKKIILFDGVCNLCDSAVQRIIKHDTKDVFRFVALQSDLGQKIIKHLGIDTQKTDSIILYQPGFAYYYKSEAALEIAKNLSGLFYFAAIFSIFPIAFNNYIYDYIAKNRYKWYGKKETCLIPTKELQGKFLE